jgi:hypothetical protein
MLTDITLEILKHLHKIEEIERNRHKFTIKEILKTYPKLSVEDKQSIIENLNL